MSVRGYDPSIDSCCTAPAYSSSLDRLTSISTPSAILIVITRPLATMDADCPIHLSDSWPFPQITHFLCFLCQTARYGNAFEASLGIPHCLCWFTLPGRVEFQVAEALVFYLILLMIIVFTLEGVIRVICGKPYSPRGWEWKTDVRLVGGLGVTMWLEIRVVRSPFVCFVGCSGHATSFGGCPQD